MTRGGRVLTRLYAFKRYQISKLKMQTETRIETDLFTMNNHERRVFQINGKAKINQTAVAEAAVVQSSLALRRVSCERGG